MRFEDILTKIVGLDNIKFYEEMSKHTTLKIGGKATVFITPTNIEQVKKIIKQCRAFKKDYCVIGAGTKLLVSDYGIDKVVICLKNKFCGIKKLDDLRMEVMSGTSLNSINKYCLNNGLCGMEETFLIPATLGGAIHNNAGAYNTSIGDVIKSVKVLENGKIKLYSKKKCKFEYRRSVFYNMPHCIILSAIIKLQKGNKNIIQKKYLEILNTRTASQPLDKKTAGSTFKRQENILPAKMIDELGLKGYRIGDAQISLKHAGFIENVKNASAKDVLNLIDFISKKVYNKYKVNLEPEIIFIGEDKHKENL